MSKRGSFIRKRLQVQVLPEPPSFSRLHNGGGTINQNPKTTMKRKLEKMGAELVIKQPEAPRRRFIRRVPRTQGVDGLLVDVRKGRFEITKRDDTDIQILDADIRDRHFLLMARDAESGTKEKFLCGFDERDWFAASVPSFTANIEQAKDNLKPQQARASQDNLGVKHRQRHKRHNKGFIRQGEWFFVPRQNLEINADLILRNEPLVRGGGGKPHLVEEIYRMGGELVYVSNRNPSGLTEQNYHRLSRNERSKYRWHTMRRNPQVYARGKVRHEDHKTVHLRDWHEVFMNREERTRHLGFLD